MAPGGSAPASAAADARLYVGANTSVGEAGGLITSRDQRRQSCVELPGPPPAQPRRCSNSWTPGSDRCPNVRSCVPTRPELTGRGRVQLEAHGQKHGSVWVRFWFSAHKRSCPEKHGGKRWRLRLSRLFSRPALLLSGVRSSPTVNLVLRGRGTGWR